MDTIVVFLTIILNIDSSTKGDLLISLKWVQDMWIHNEILKAGPI